jgi:dTDP-4-dehydrorhamnose 3,5-epimerase
VADVVYKCSSYYDVATEAGIAYDDPDIGIAWPLGVEPIVSERDASAPRLADVAATLPFRI